MKRFKRAASLLLAVMMIATMFSSVTIASANTEVDKYEIVAYAVDELTAGTTVNVTATLKRVVDENNTNSYTATVINAVYAGDELVAVDGVTKEFPFWGTTQTFDSALEIPAGKTDLALKTLLWDGDGYTSLKPLAVSSDEAKVEGFVVEGIEATKVNDTTYSVDLPKGTPAEPKVATLANGFVNAVVTYPTNGVINVLANGVNYTINYTLPVVVKGALTNITSTRGGVVTPLTEHGVLKEIPEITDNTITYAQLLGVTSDEEIKNVASPAWSNRQSCIMTEIPDMFVGMNYVIWPLTGEAGEDIVEFTTNKDVDIYFSASDTWKDDDAIKIVNKGFRFQYLFTAGYDSFAATAIKDYPDGAINSWDVGGLIEMGQQAMYKKEIRLAEGEPSKTVQVKVTTDPAVQGTWGFNKFFYVFPEETPTITSATVAQISDGSSSNMVYQGTVRNLPDNITDSTTFAQIWDFKSWGSYADNAMPAVTNLDGYIYTEFPEEFEGMKYLAPDNYNNSVYCVPMNLKFTASKSVRIYYPATSDHHDDDATFYGTKTTATLHVGGNQNETWGSQVPGINTANTTMYTKDIIVPEGETVDVTVKLRATAPDGKASHAFPFLVYEFIENPVAEKPPVVVSNYKRWGLNSAGAPTDEFGGEICDLVLPNNFVQREENGNYYPTAEPIDNPDDVWDIWDVRLTRPDADNYYVLTYVPDEILGAKLLRWSSQFVIESAPMARFTINQDATLYFDTSDENVEKLGAVRMDDSIKYREWTGTGAEGTNEWNTISEFNLTPAQYNRTDLAGEEELHSGRLFKLELKVPAGQSSATFEIPLQIHDDQQPFILIK